MALLFINRILFGFHATKPYASVFGLVRWTWRKLVIEKIAAKYAQPDGAAAA